MEYYQKILLFPMNVLLKIKDFIHSDVIKIQIEMQELYFLNSNSALNYLKIIIFAKNINKNKQE